MLTKRLVVPRFGAPTAVLIGALSALAGVAFLTDCGVDGRIGVELALKGADAGDASSPDAGALDAGGGVDADGGTPAPDAGIDAAADDAGDTVDADAGDTVDADTDAGAIDAGDAGPPPPPPNDGGALGAIRFGATPGGDGLFSTSPVDPNLRTVAGWFRLRVTMVGQNRNTCPWSLENNAPSNAYQLLTNTYHADAWESHDSAQGGFLFAPVDLGWWFVAETNRLSGPVTTLYWKKLGAATLSVMTGDAHPNLTGVTRFLVGTDDATGQNEWLDGDIAGVKVWGAELSHAELELEANQLSPVRSANLHAFYPLQSVVTMTVDFSGNGRNLAPITPAIGSWSVQPGPTIPY